MPEGIPGDQDAGKEYSGGGWWSDFLDSLSGYAEGGFVKPANDVGSKASSGKSSGAPSSGSSAYEGGESEYAGSIPLPGGNAFDMGMIVKGVVAGAIILMLWKNKNKLGKMLRK